MGFRKVSWALVFRGGAERVDVGIRQALLIERRGLGLRVVTEKGGGG